MRKQKVKKNRDRLFALLYILLIYISLPVMPQIWQKLTQGIGSLTDYFAAIILLIVLIIIVWRLILQQKDIINFIWLIILVLLFAIGLVTLELPVERVHFIEYGLLTFFVFRALRHNFRAKAIYLITGITVFIIGLIDEGIQYILPNRVYETRDVFVNGIAGILGLLIIGLCFQPKLES